MSKLQKCLYLIDLLERRGPMSLKEINKHYRYSSLYDGDIQPRTFLRYKDYILLNFPCYIEFNASTQKYYLIKNDYNKGNQSLYEYLLSAFHIEGMSEKALSSTIGLSTSRPRSALPLFPISCAHGNVAGISLPNRTTIITDNRSLRWSGWRILC